MSDIKWIKITTDMFDNEKIRLIDAMPERDTIHYVWMRLLVQAGKTNANGFIYLSDQIPYTEEMLSTLFNRNINSIRLALSVLENFKMINIEENKEIKIVNWEKYQNVEGVERIREQTRKRVAKCRERKKEEKANVTKSNVTVTEQKEKEKNKNKEDLEVDEEKEIRLDQDKNLDENREKNTKDEKLNDGGINVQAVQISALGNGEEAGFRLLCYFEKMTGRMGGLNIGALNVASKEHGEEHVKMAIDKALETNVFSMNYINGILRNWRKEGYPSKEVVKVESGLDGDGSKFKGIESQNARELTDEERENAKKLI
ncbi:MAG: phage replisome organizer N-terminal domain-containing protein [Clostridium sp.]|uniref:phage replisome organizer N-terminal domain-containing protein n=1 Tax=Clostridium sp. DSM 8431 TaxID=1761781 RepID=UPI000B7E38E8|nr:phage replisome organizer N-terminal domain-containing protein [Clostridium sp. DSM 8431]MCR4944656.1 phage replisome organizer N-terminal domain-containing protein [Clostridium sp.]